jgi:transcriptional regulator with XRE-family HTH domain
VVADEDRRLLDAVGRRIAELRRKLGLTQAEIAERLETTISNYQRIEHGFQNLTILTMAKIAAALDTKINALLKAPRTVKSKRGRPRKTR